MHERTVVLGRGHVPPAFKQNRGFLFPSIRPHNGVERESATEEQSRTERRTGLCQVL